MAFVASAAARSGFTRSWHAHSFTSITRQKPTTLISPCQSQRLSHHLHTQKPRPTPVTPQRTLPPTRRLKSTTTRKRLLTPRTIPVLLALAIAGVAWDSQWLFPASAPSSDLSEATILANARKFVPFTVTSKDPVSPTSFILTLKPPHTGPAPLSSLWDVFDLWCVEVKQPQIQVAREYTPLPGAAGDDALRLYVRALRGGEVSTYLSRLLPGDSVEIRGPHGEFDLRSRLGEAGGRVVFLAGGTGVASALQAALAVLPRGVDVTIFWAVRGREEVQGAAPAKQKGSTSSWGWNPFSGGKRAGGIQAEALSAEVGDASAISRELLALKERYGDRVDVRVVVDQEGTRVGEQDLSTALAQAGPKKREGPPPVSTEGCKFHSQTAHVGMVDGAPNAGKRFLSKDEDCACVPKEGVAIGKNVFVISGPEGFVQAYAGPKIWRDGGQLQGPVGGLLGAMQKGNPDLLKDWIVLKL
ncbi:Cytochrome c mitochondrial import factor CYC2 [Colletotrichum siamense]|nr:Cytochrome c mitochondrial import factor CYC2 [Colletotrichum siamense]